MGDLAGLCAAGAACRGVRLPAGWGHGATSPGSGHGVPRPVTWAPRSPSGPPGLLGGFHLEGAWSWKSQCPCRALFAWADACGSPGGGGHAGPPSLRACPARALTLLQLLLVVCFGLGGHDLEKGLENTSQVAGVVGLQLVGHPWGRMAEGGVRPTSSLGGGKKRLPNPRDNSSCRSKSSGGKGHQGRGDPGSSPGRRFLSFAQLYLGSRPPH